MVHQSLFEEVRELQTRLEEQNQRLARLEQQLQTLNLRGPPCPRCDQGEMLREDDRLQCSGCGYAHPL